MVLVVSDSVGTSGWPSGARYRTVVQTCDRCLQQSGPIHQLTEKVCGEAACDREVVDLRPGREQGRLQRTVSPTVRRTVLHHQGGGCALPGCLNRLWVDVHFVIPRCQGGTHDPDNLIALCTAHHRLVHRGNLAIEWAAPGLLEVRRASGRGSWRRLWREPGAIEAAAECRHDPRGDAQGWIQLIHGTLDVRGLRLYPGDGLALTACDHIDLLAHPQGVEALLFDLLFGPPRPVSIRRST